MTARKPDDWMPLRIGEYLADTTHLTRDQHGAYLLLIMAYWRRGEALPADDGQLAAIAKATPAEWRKMKPIIAQFFRCEDGRWFQKRCEEELVAARALVAQRSVAGKASAAAREAQRKVNGCSTGVERYNKQNGNEIPDLLPSTKNPEPAAAEADADRDQFAQLHRLLAFDGNDQKNWLEFIAMKTRHGLDFATHILPAAQHHASTGKRGSTLAYIRPKALELRDHAAIAATAPVVFEDTHDGGWLERLKFFHAHPELSERDRWPAKWGPRFDAPGTRVPAPVLETFNATRRAA